MLMRMVRLAITLTVLGWGTLYFYQHHETVESISFRAIAATALLGIVFVFCALKAAMISLSNDKLEAASAAGNTMAKVVSRFRKDSAHMILVIGFMITLSTLMLGDLTEAVMPNFLAKVGVALLISIVAEVIADYVGIKHNLKLAHALSPLTQLLFDLLIIVKPISYVITKLLGHEEDEVLEEGVLGHMLRKQARVSGGELGKVEAHLLLHALDNDHRPMEQLANPIAPSSLFCCDRFEDNLPILPAVGTEQYRALLERLGQAVNRWAVFTDIAGRPLAVLDVRRFGSELAFRGDNGASIYHFLHRANVVDGKMELCDAILKFELESLEERRNVVKVDVLLVDCGGEDLRIYTAADFFGDQVTGLVDVRFHSAASTK